MMGIDLDMRAGRTTIPLDPTFEHSLIVTVGTVRVGEQVATPGHLVYLGGGRSELPVDAAEPARALLLGGIPFPERLLMWWNFVARTQGEVEAAYEDWASDSGRFGQVKSSMTRIETVPPLWMSRHS
jgi:redox-sensitive bicupin YhaK (pirin superfamily)